MDDFVCLENAVLLELTGVLAINVQKSPKWLVNTKAAKLAKIC
jgi:hypothetical protein